MAAIPPALSWPLVALIAFFALRTPLEQATKVKYGDFALEVTEEAFTRGLDKVPQLSPDAMELLMKLEVNSGRILAAPRKGYNADARLLTPRVVELARAGLVHIEVDDGLLEDSVSGGKERPDVLLEDIPNIVEDILRERATDTAIRYQVSPNGRRYKDAIIQSVTRQLNQQALEKAGQP